MGSIQNTHTKAASVPYLFDDKPLFGLDIGHSKARVFQVDLDARKPRVIGYGETSFDPTAIKDGVITRHEEIAGAIQRLFRHSLVGDITTKRVAVSLPVSHAFTRSIELPKLTGIEIEQAINNEVSQYIPAALESLYVGYTTERITKDKWSTMIVAVPRRIVDSYIVLTRLLGLEVVLIQTTSAAGARLFSLDKQSDAPSVLVDLGSNTSDITIFDKIPVVSGIAAFGGEELTTLISKTLGVTAREAAVIKTKYGLNYSKKQKQITQTLEPSLQHLTKEIQRSIRYYEERSKNQKKIAQIIVMGGGAQMPGLTDYFTDALRLPARSFDPTTFVEFGHLQPLSGGDRMSYITAIGLSLAQPREVF